MPRFSLRLSILLVALTFLAQIDASADDTPTTKKKKKGGTKKSSPNADEVKAIEKLKKKIEALENQGRYREALPLQRQLVEQVKTTLGSQSTDAAAQFNILADLYKKTGQYAKAEPLYRRSLDIWEASRGKTTLMLPPALTTWPCCTSPWASTRKRSHSTSAAWISMG